MPIPGSLEAHLSHQGSRASSAGCHKLGFQSAALAALATSAPGGMPPRNYAKTILSATSSLQKHSPLLPSTVWSAVQALQAQAERSRSRLSKGADGQLLTYLCEDQEASKLQAAAAQAADGLVAAVKASAYAEAAFKADVSSAVQKLLHSHCAFPAAQSQLISSTRALVQEVDGEGPPSASTVQRGVPVISAAAAEVFQGNVCIKVIEQELAYLQGALQRQQQQQQQGGGALSHLEAATAQVLVACLQRLQQQLVEEAARAAEAAAAAEAARQKGQDTAAEAAASCTTSSTTHKGQQAQVPAVGAVASQLAQASFSGAVPSGHLSTSSSFDRSTHGSGGAEAGASSSGSSSNPASGVPSSSGTASSSNPGCTEPSSSGAAAGLSSNEWYFPPRHLAQAAACNSSGNRGSLDVLLYRGSTLGGFGNSSSYPGSPRSSMDVAAAEAQLDAFLKDSKLPLNRTARTIASSMQLPPGGLSKVLEFMRDNGRVKGLALASNELGDQDVQELCAALKGSSSLRSLELPRNCIGDVGAGALADLVAASPQLATLLLGYNHIGDLGAVALAKAAETSRGLTRLSLHSNQIGAAGCAALAQAVARSPALVALDFLPGNLASEADVKVLGRALKAKLNTPTGVVCLRCLFEALSSDTMLVSRRMFLLRRFAELEVPGAADAQAALLGDACSQYPDYLLDHLMAALAVAGDQDLSAALQELCLHMAGLAGFFRDALVDRLAAVAEGQAWAGGQASGGTTCSSCLPPAAAYLQLLGSLCAAYTSAEGPCSRLLAVLSSGSTLVEALLQGMRAGDPLLRCATLRLLASVLASGAGQVPQAVQAALLLQLVDTLSALSAAEEQQLGLASLQQLVEQGGALMMEQLVAAPGGLSPAGHSLMQGLRRALLAGDVPTQLAGVQLAVAVTSSAAASPQLLNGLLQADLCEQLVEVVRVTLQEQQLLVQQHQQQQQAPGLSHPQSQPSQQQGGPWTSSQGAAGLAASVAARCDMCETIQLATVTALRHLSTQGEEFLLHLQFGLETIARLIAAAASSSHHQLLLAALSLINDTSASTNWLRMLPAAVLQQVTKALTSCLLEQVEGQAPAAGELQPCDELAAVHVMACRLLTWICECAAATPSLWTALKGALAEAALQAAAALPLFDTPTLLQGYLAASCGLLQQVCASCSLDAAGATPNTPFMQQQQQPGSQQPRNQLAARLQRPTLQGDAAGATSPGTSCAEELLLALLTCTADHVLPALCRAIDITAEGAAAASAGGAALPQGCCLDKALAPALRCVITMLQSGNHCAELQGAAGALADLLLSQHAWVGTSLHLLRIAGQVEESGARLAAWELLLLLLGTTDELGLLTGVQTTPEQLAGQLTKMVPCPSQLLEAMLPHQRQQQQQQQQQQPAGSRGRSQAPSTRSNSISAYCSLSDAQIAMLALLAAAVRGGCCLWPMEQVLLALNLLVAQHAPALQRQPGLLTSIVTLYATTEQQAALAQEEAVAVPGGQLQLGDPGLSDMLQSAPQHIMAALLQAPGFRPPPATLVSHWVCSKARCAPAVALKLLQAWVGDLQAAAAGSTPSDAAQMQGPSQGSSQEAASPGSITPELLSGAQQLYQEVLLVLGRAPDASGLLLEACATAQGPFQQQLWLLVLAGLPRHSPAAASALAAGVAAGIHSAGGMGSSSSSVSSAGGLMALTRRMLLTSLGSLQHSPLAVCGALCCAWVLSGLVDAAGGTPGSADTWQLGLSSMVQQAQMLVTAANRLPQAGPPCQQQLQLAALELINSLSSPQAGGASAGTLQHEEVLPHLCSLECAGLASSLAAAACQQPPGKRNSAGTWGPTSDTTQCREDSNCLCVVEALLVTCQALQPEGTGHPPLAQQLAAAPNEQLLAAALQWQYNCMKLLLRGRLQAAMPGGAAAALLPLVSPLCSKLLQQQLEQQVAAGQQNTSAAHEPCAVQQQGGGAEEAPAVFGLGIADVLVLVEACRGSHVAPLLLRSLWMALLLLQGVVQPQKVGPTAAAAGQPGRAAAVVGADTVQLALCLLPCMAASAGCGDAAGAQLAPWADCCLAALVQLAHDSHGGTVLGLGGSRLVLGGPWGGRWVGGMMQRLCGSLGELQLLVEGQGGGQGFAADTVDAEAGQACAEVCLAGCSILAAGLQQPGGGHGDGKLVSQCSTWLARPGLGQAVREEAAKVLQQEGLLRLLVWAVGWGVPGLEQQEVAWRQAGVGAVAAQLLLELWRGGLLQPHLQLLRAAVQGWGPLWGCVCLTWQ